MKDDIFNQKETKKIYIYIHITLKNKRFDRKDRKRGRNGKQYRFEETSFIRFPIENETIRERPSSPATPRPSNPSLPQSISGRGKQLSPVPSSIRLIYHNKEAF